MYASAADQSLRMAGLAVAGMGLRIDLAHFGARCQLAVEVRRIERLRGRPEGDGFSSRSVS